MGLGACATSSSSTYVLSPGFVLRNSSYSLIFRTAWRIGRYPDFIDQNAWTSGRVIHFTNVHASFGAFVWRKIARYSPPTTVARPAGPAGSGAIDQSRPLIAFQRGRFQGPSRAIASRLDANA